MCVVTVLFLFSNKGIEKRARNLTCSKKLCRNYFNYDSVKYILTTRPTSDLTGYVILYEPINIA